MPKNLTALAFLELENPELADKYKQIVLEKKRERSRDQQRKMREAYAKEKNPEN